MSEHDDAIEYLRNRRRSLLEDARRITLDGEIHEEKARIAREVAGALKLQAARLAAGIVALHGTVGPDEIEGEYKR